jgi:NAD(P)-dependent dehydrogenase (short-subunit alcohol dehydrogenase family)
MSSSTLPASPSKRFFRFLETVSADLSSSNIPAETYEDDLWEKTMAINLNGAFKMARAVARSMIGNKNPGSIIYIASMSGSIVNYPQEQSAYNASKAGVIHLAHSLAAEWAKHGIRVNSISPGYMDTALNRVPALDAQKKIWIAQTPQQRLGGVDELNNLAVFLASDASSYMTGKLIPFLCFLLPFLKHILTIFVLLRRQLRHRRRILPLLV